MIGRVVSTKGLKSATVLLERTKRHPLYKKSSVSTKKYLVDDSVGVKDGDIVEFVKCAPVSKRKHWKITKVLGQDIVALGEKHLQEKARQAIEEVMPVEEKKEVISEEVSVVSEKKEAKKKEKK